LWAGWHKHQSRHLQQISGRTLSSCSLAPVSILLGDHWEGDLLLNVMVVVQLSNELGPDGTQVGYFPGLQSGPSLQLCTSNSGHDNWCDGLIMTAV
jgi:hypothetical protein